MKDFLEQLMRGQLAAEKLKREAAADTLELHLFRHQSDRLNANLKEFGETTPASIAVSLISQLESEIEIEGTAQMLGKFMPADELAKFKSWQQENKRRLRVAIHQCVDKM